MRFGSYRKWLIYWMYLIAIAHLVGGILVSWFSNIDSLDAYHNDILRRFGEPSIQLHHLHIWWLNLFGATLQNVAIFMGILIYIGNKVRNALVWLWMAVGLVVWFPQDIIISLRIDLWAHVWVDAIAMLVLLPPLIFLWIIDKDDARA